MTANQQNDYYQDGSSWYHERYELLAISKNRYQMLSFFLLGLVACSVLAIACMMPLKQYVYRLIEVSKETGEVTQLSEIDSKKYETNWVMIRYFIHQYVLNRHSYSFEDIKRTFNLALAMSSKPLADELTQHTIDTNPESPLNILNKNFYRTVDVMGINQLNDHTSLVRFKMITHNKNAANDVKPEDFQAVVKWEFSHEKETLHDRDKNPLGFIVNYYQVSPVFLKNNKD